MLDASESNPMDFLAFPLFGADARFWADPQLWASLLTLTVMEIVLGIDNLVLLTVMADRLPEHQRPSARRIGLLAALGTRLVLLLSIAWIMRLTAPIIELPWHSFSWRDLILIGGGLFLVYKGTDEIHQRIEGEDAGPTPSSRRAGFAGTIVQIAVLDIVFSLDSVITAVGMASHLPVMIAAIVIAIGIMMLASGTVAGFIGRHPTVKMLALSFLLLIGMTLIGDGFGAHVPKGYIYAAMGFSALVEVLNQVAARSRRGRRSV
jgi:predicted tellurium resistance membrane protein TerC